MRSLARKSVFEYLYSKLFNPSDEGLFDVLISKLSDEDKEFAKSLLKFVLDNEEKYSSDLERLALNYKFNRLLNVDKCALYIGMAELDNFIDTPTPVIIDEAIKLSAIYSTERSVDFVNGILATYSKEIGRNV